MITEQEFLKNLDVLRDKLATSCSNSNRSFKDVSILPVTKNWPVNAVSYACRAGFKRVGENRVQEAISKQDDAVDTIINWDLIGHLQSNKVKFVANRFQRIQTVDSIKLLTKLDAALSRANAQISILIQVNTGMDPAKSGISEEKCEELLVQALELKTINVDGFMTIAPFSPENKSVARNAFCKLRILRDKMTSIYKIPLNELSMGMSGDLDEAVREGSTMIRVGSALYGKRS
jgi:pyridoxal phosphate enzyme (YggS family)